MSEITTYQIIIPGKPHPCARPRRSAHGGMFDPEPNKTAKRVIGIHARQAGVQPIDGAIAMEVVCEFKRPKSHYKAGGVLKETAPNRHIQKPDCDNLMKTIKDGLTGIAYVDDCQVVSATIYKEWTETDAQTTVTVWSEI